MSAPAPSPAPGNTPGNVPGSNPGNTALASGGGYPAYRRWVHVLAVGLVVATFALVVIGGHVTSKDAGMAVPDGFTTFGVWSLIAPLETWWGDEGTRLEHSHRLKGYVVGGLTLALVIALFATQRCRRWVKVLGVGLLVLVLVQAAMGILRVDENSVVLAGLHGVTGQVFLCLTVLAAAAVGKFWMTRPTPPEEARHQRTVRVLPLVLLGALVVQLALGSAVRHSQSALAIPDWPTHYGQVVPPMSQGDIDAAVAAVPEADRAERFAPATLDADGNLLPGGYAAWQVHLHFSHRLGAYAIFAFGVWFVAWLWRNHGGRPAVLVPASLFGVFLLLQVGLGVMTVLSGEHATLATSHQAVGALLIATATWLAVRLHLVPAAADRPAHVPVAAGDATTEVMRKSSGNLDAESKGGAPAADTPAPSAKTTEKPEPVTA